MFEVADCVEHMSCKLTFNKPSLMLVDPILATKWWGQLRHAPEQQNSGDSPSE
jgi:hypothetical protein